MSIQKLFPSYIATVHGCLGYIDYEPNLAIDAPIEMLHSARGTATGCDALGREDRVHENAPIVGPNRQQITTLSRRERRAFRDRQDGRKTDSQGSQ